MTTLAELMTDMHEPLPNGGYRSKPWVIDHGDGTRSEGQSSMSSTGAVQSVTLALLQRQHQTEIDAWMARYGGEPCAAHGLVITDEDGFSWSPNDYLFTWDDPASGPVFDWWGWHGGSSQGEFCIAAMYRVVGCGGVFQR